MTHEAGIEAAADTLVTEMYPPATDMQGARHSARLIVEAYLSASGMVLVPRVPTEEMLNQAYECDMKYVDETSPPDEYWSAMISVSPDPFKSKP